MAETLVSPGVLARENDQSFITQQPVQVGAAIVGPTVKGPVEIPTVVTTYSDYQNRFGTTFESGSDDYSFFTSIAAQNYFNNGGNTLLVTRVVSASATWVYASADVYTAEAESGNLSTATDNLLEATINAFNITGSALTEVTGISPTGGSGTGAVVKLTLATSQSFGTITVTNAGSGYAVGDILTIPSASAGAFGAGGTDITFTLVDANVVDEVAFTLEALDKGIIFNNSGPTPGISGSQLITGGSGSLYSGSSDNIRWEIANTSTLDGNFNLLIRQGNDNDNNKIVLESWTNLSLDPKADNYIARIIGDQYYNYNSTENYIEITGSYANASRYVRISAVNSPTPNYFDNAGNAKSQYTGSIPSVGSGSFGGTFSGGVGTVISALDTNSMYQYIGSNDNTQGLVGDDYNHMLNLLSNQDDYQFNVLVTPGLLNGDSDHISQITTALNNTQMRGDSIYLIDPVAYASSITAVNTQANSRNSSYGAMYWPWLQTIDPDMGDQVWVPASTMVPGVYAFNDNASEPWFAPAGINRGGLATVIRPERKLSQSNRDSLYQNKVNPIASFPGVGTVVYGQKTLQRQASALDRVNVRRLLIQLKSYIGQVAQTLVFEQNTAATRNNFLAIVNPYLESVVQRQGLYAFKVVMDDSNNTPDVIDRNQMVGAIYLQPTKTAEFIILDFNLLPTGATFPS